ncbi:MAG: choice-of-anchor Q domain-containing protein, partial [Flavobacteriales bacterium]
MKRLLLLLSVFVAISTQAQTTWVVDSLNDSGFGSLRAAADSCSSGDTIRFNPNLIANGSDSIVLTSGEILFDDSLDVVIVGMYNSQDTLFFSGNKSSRIFKFWETGKVTLDSLVLRNGYTSVSHQYDGGAIFRWNSWDTMFIKNCIIYDNQASDDGGGIFCNGPMFNSYVVIKGSIIKGNKSPNGAGVYCISLPGYRYSRASVIVEKSIIKGNIGTGNGGGVYVGSCNSFVSIKDSEISNNSGNNGGGVYCLATNWQYNSLRSTVDIYSSSFSGNYANSGGGVYLESKNSRTNVYGSTFNNNVALGNGGGIYSKSNGGPSIISVSTSTFWENSSLNGTGGAMCENSFYGVFNIANSTIAMNSAVNGIGGVFGLSSSCNFNLSSSIFVENGVNTSGLSSFNNPVFVSSGYNIFSDSLNGMTPLDSFNVSLAQLNLQGLSFNGGITKTVLLGTGSIAIDNGNPLDSSDAQNAPIFGVRDIGAAEGCFAVPTTMVVSLCDSLSYSSPSGNSIYTQSGVYFDTLSAACGADSVFIIDLTLGFPNHYIDTIVACDSLTWIDGITYYSSNNTAKDTLVNVLGCDSIVYLDLTIINSSTYTDVIIACDSLTWINGITYYSSNNTAKDTLVNALGCDSIVTLDLTILQSSHSMQILADCDSLTWINGVTYYQDTIDSYTVTNSVGCDSVITLDLTINHFASST